MRDNISNNLNNIGDAYLKLGKTKLAIETIAESLEIARETNNEWDIALSSLSLAEAHMEAGNFKLALKFAKESLDLSNKIGSDLSDLQYTHEVLSEIYYELNQYQLAYDHFSIHNALHDSLNSTNNIKKVTSLELQYKHDQETQATLLAAEQTEAIHQAETEKQKVIKYGLIGGFVVMLIFALTITSASIVRKKANLKLTAQNSLIKEQKEQIAMNLVEVKTLNHSLDNTNNMLQQLSKFKERLTGMIVHDLKNPLNSIINLTKERLTINAGKQMLNMVLNILDVQKFESAQFTLQQDTLQLRSLVDKAIEQVYFLAERKSIKINNRIPQGMKIFAEEEIQVGL